MSVDILGYENEIVKDFVISQFCLHSLKLNGAQTVITLNTSLSKQ